jgi:cytochrome c-type biogenesis protein CcmH
MRAVILTTLVYISLAILAAAFVCWPIFRARKGFSRLLLAAASALLVLGLGGGLYLVVGAPSLGLRTFTAPENSDLPGLVARLARRARNASYDVQGWTLLGRGYLTLGDAADAAAAFRRGAMIAPPEQRSDLFCAYGEALMAGAQGAVTPEAEAAFTAAAAINPRDFRARYDLGFVYLSRRDTAHALAIWEGVLAEAPADAPWRGGLVDRVAALKSQAGAAPDIGAMVAGLAQRLAAHPDDPQGWQRLVRAYAVLGDEAKAQAALAGARAALKNDAASLTALSDEARSLKLDK